MPLRNPVRCNWPCTVMVSSEPATVDPTYNTHISTEWKSTKQTDISPNLSLSVKGPLSVLLHSIHCLFSDIFAIIWYNREENSFIPYLSQCCVDIVTLWVTLGSLKNIGYFRKGKWELTNGILHERRWIASTHSDLFFRAEWLYLQSLLPFTSHFVSWCYSVLQ